ncbi:Lipase A [Lachnellula suecica]|uniref:Lipase A n=1 Tax=Lachnellula suecica TaxID=602035 RepID=A0A8T9C9P9_9HELO|nr:Lipase A [Lachnellula suecica]
MRHITTIFNLLIVFASIATCLPTTSSNATIPPQLFQDLEQLSRVVDIAYCVGSTGIFHPFTCASRCSDADFAGWELVDTFNTGPLMSDSCGYIVLDHGSGNDGQGRIIVAFRGTYSIANTIVDLSTVPQEYVPYSGGNASESRGEKKGKSGNGWRFWDRTEEENRENDGDKARTECRNCTVHTGFLTSWHNTRPFILPHLTRLKTQYPSYDLSLVGHSLGGAVAALAGLECEALGWEPTVTTFGEPRVGNAGLRDYIDDAFGEGRYRRVTHVDDPVPLLPLSEWGYRAHAGEVFIGKEELQPGVGDVWFCEGDEDRDCSAGAELDELQVEAEEQEVLAKRWGIPIPARLGLCVPGGDPLDWGRERYDFGDGDQVQVEL